MNDIEHDTRPADHSNVVMVCLLVAVLIGFAAAVYQFHQPVGPVIAEPTAPGTPTEEHWCSDEPDRCDCLEQASRTSVVTVPCCPVGEEPVIHSDPWRYECELSVVRHEAPAERWVCAFASEYHRIEDSFLRTVLGSPIDDDPLFGLSEYGMDAAECAARRWRLEGR